jgi:hypothetical protein
LKRPALADISNVVDVAEVAKAAETVVQASTVFSLLLDGEESDPENDPPFSLEEEDTPSDAFSGLPFMPPPSECPFFSQYNEPTLSRLAQTIKQSLSECADLGEKHHAHGLLRLLGEGEEMEIEYIKSLICCFPISLWVTAQQRGFNMRTIQAIMLKESVLSESQFVDHGKLYIASF